RVTAAGAVPLAAGHVFHRLEALAAHRGAEHQREPKSEDVLAHVHFFFFLGAVPAGFAFGFLASNSLSRDSSFFTPSSSSLQLATTLMGGVGLPPMDRAAVASSWSWVCFSPSLTHEMYFSADSWATFSF